MKQGSPKLILRDDDLSYFGRPEDLRRMYDGIWDCHPIHFSVIPKVYSRQSEVPQDVEHEKDYYSIHENAALVDFLREKIQEGKVIIDQHGFTHRNYDDRYELERNSQKQMTQELSEGKRMLEETFDVTIDTLVAPHDRFSKVAIFAAEEIGYRFISRGFAPLKREIQWGNGQYLRSYAKLVLFWLKNKTRLRYPTPLDFGKHMELFSYRIEDINRSNIPAIVKNASPNGVISVTFHYRAFSMLHREIINCLLDEIYSTRARS